MLEHNVNVENIQNTSLPFGESKKINTTKNLKIDDKGEVELQNLFRNRLNL